LLVNLNDIDEFADALVTLSSNDVKRKELGINAREFVMKNYDLQVISSRWKKIIMDLIQ
jgi:glycosyltransferase involved in cell wall biosynthesis